MEVIKRESQRNRGGGGQEDEEDRYSQWPRHGDKDTMMKRNTHEGERERAAGAKCERRVKAQQGEPVNGEHPGTPRKERRGGSRNTTGGFSLSFFLFFFVLVWASTRL